VQLVFQFEQPLGFFFFQPGERHAGHLADDLGDHFLIDDAVDFLGLFAPLPLHFLFSSSELLGLIAQLGGFSYSAFDRFVLLNA
jgi:hypothetical protein